MELESWDFTKEYTLYYFNKLILTKFDFFILNCNDDFFLFLKNINNFLFILNFIKLNSLLNFNFFCDLTVADFFYNKIRYKIVYNLTNLTKGLKLFLNLFLDNSLNFLPSISTIYAGSTWAEREIWDMFGIFFINNNSLKRILTDYGFKGHPLKKDFPLIGYFEIYYSAIIGEVNYRSVELAQEYKFYNLESN